MTVSRIISMWNTSLWHQKLCRGSCVYGKWRQLRQGRQVPGRAFVKRYVECNDNYRRVDVALKLGLAERGLSLIQCQAVAGIC